MEPGTEQVIEAKLESEFEHNTGIPGILEESRERRGNSEITIARSLVIPRNGPTLVRVANFSDRPNRLRGDLPVAEYHPVSSGDGRVVPMEPDHDSARTSRLSCLVIDRPGLKGEPPKNDEKWRSEL